MQKKIIALALAAGLSGAAFAQSNVTISGQMKLHFEGVQAPGGTVPGTNALSRNRVTQNTSRVIFSGEEGLGSGLSAYFMIDSEVNADQTYPTGGVGNNGGSAGAFAGNGSGLFGSRQAWVGLKHAQFGSVQMGRMDMHYTEHAPVDMAGFDALSLNTNTLNLMGLLAQTHGAAGRGTMGGRIDNVVAWLSPNFSGFSAKFAYSTGSELTAPQSANSNYGKDSMWQIALKYDNGPINLGYSRLQQTNIGNASETAAIGTLCVNTITGAVSAGAACALPNVALVVTDAALAGGAAVVGGAASTGQQGNDQNSNKFWAGYTFPMGLKLGLVIERSERENVNGTSANNDLQRSMWAIPVSYKTGNHTFYFTVGEAGSLTGGAAALAGLNNSGSKMHMLAYNYDFSKRTAANVSWTRMTNDTNAGFDFWTRSVQGTAQIGADPSSLAIGVRHSF